MPLRDVRDRVRRTGVITAALAAIAAVGAAGAVAASTTTDGTTSHPVTLCVANSSTKVVTDPGRATCRKGLVTLRLASAADARTLARKLDSVATIVHNFAAGFRGTLEVASGVSVDSFHWDVTGAHLRPGSMVHQCDSSGCIATYAVAAAGYYQLADQTPCGADPITRWWTATDYAGRAITSPALEIVCG